MSAVKYLNDSNFANEVEQNSRPVLVDFYADWCAPCRILAPSIEEIAEEYRDKATVAKLNVDQNPSVAMRFGIMGIPTMLFFKDGQMVQRVVGLVRKNELSRTLDGLLDQVN